MVHKFRNIANMKVVGLLLLTGFSAVFASEQLWMELMSAQIVNADGDVANADKNIPQLATDLGLKTLVTLVKKAGLVDALSGTGPFTVFGPTDDAFSKLPKPFVDFLLKNVTVLADILKYHVANGKVLSKDLKNDELVPSLLGSDIRINIYKNGEIITASGRQVTLPDQEASNGVIHEVGGVLFPPPGTITSVVKKCPVFSTLLKAVGAAPGIAGTLDGKGPFTLFAPSDKAFAKIPEKCLDALLKNTTLLTKVLEYHVVPSTMYSAGLSCGDKLKTVEGGDVKVTKVFGRTWINRSRVTYADGTTTNGVIHVINRVLFPRCANDICGDAYADDDNDNKENADENIFKAFFSN
ncbi:transforming growth factor-beta-induced protein ig-h3-like [Mercenaria mercenaria]|uniref:transforming growth factor-beta-induced protein ig-h3-like n=1 Tax=Mercenaria mercenaria TaxID=6596 RepID=UPI001E1D3564|nr:transforming growth factor-beta-induced protein ig-h3-like [Mercenaria mercenaria]